MSAQSSQDKTQNGYVNTTQNPWAPQAPYLTQGFNAASGALGQAQNTPAPSSFVSQFSPDQLAAFQQMQRFGTSNPQIAGSSAAAGGALTGAGANATQQGLFGLANYRAPTAQDIATNTNTFSQNPQIQGMIDAATRDARNAVSENVLPSIGRNAAATGNSDSSRTGVAEGIVNRGLANTVADTSANIRGQAYNSGLSAAQNLAGLQQQGQLGALSGLVSGGTGAVGTGVGANSGAVAQQGGLYDIANQGIAGQQQASQAALNDALARYQFGVSSPFAGLNNYWNIVGGQNYGGTTQGINNTQGTTTNNPSNLATAGAYTGILSSLFGGK